MSIAAALCMGRRVRDEADDDRPRPTLRARSTPVLAPAPALPPELLLDILAEPWQSAYAEALAYKPSISIDAGAQEPLLAVQAQLARYTRVCRGWHAAARTLLYRMPVISTRAQLGGLMRTQESFKSIIVQDHVLHASPEAVIPGSFSPVEESAPGYVVLCDLLRRQHVCTLQLWGDYRIGDHAQGTHLHLPALIDACAAHLRHLSIQGSPVFDHGFESLPPGAFPRLTELSLRDVSLPSGAFVPPAAFPALRKLRFMHCHRPDGGPLMPSVHAALETLELFYNIIDDRALTALARTHAPTLRALQLIGKTELRAFAALVASPDALTDAERRDPFVGPGFAAPDGPATLPALRSLAVALIAQPEARHFDFALRAWTVPPTLETLVLARRRWKPRDCTPADLEAVHGALALLLRDPTAPPPSLRAVVVEGAVAGRELEPELAVLTRTAELCAEHGVRFEMTQRDVAAYISACVVDPAWAMNDPR